MKLQATLTFGLALALIGAAGLTVAAPPVTTAPSTYGVTAPNAAPAYGQLSQTQVPPATTPTAPTYGYRAPQATYYGYPAAPVAAAPVAAAPQVAQQPTQLPVYGLPAYGQQPYAQPPVAPAAPQPQVAVQPQVGVGGYPMAPVHVAQTLPTPSGSGTRAAVEGPAMAAPAEPVPAMTPPAPAVVAAPAPVESHSHAHPAADSWTGYTAAPTGDCATGQCNTMPYEGGDCDPCGAPACDLSCGSSCPSRQWFFGLYGLLLERDSPGRAIVAAEVQTPPAGVYYPQPGTDRFLSTSDIDPDFRGGAEIRFGSTLGCATDPCTGSCYHPLAWEIGYWAITDDPDQAVLIDDLGTGDVDRIYGSQNYAGLEYNREGGGYRPLNDYWDYQVPVDGTSTNDIRVLAVRVRQNFEAQNLELNLWRFGAPGVGCGASSCGAGCGDLACGTGCGTDACGSSCGYDTCGCAPCVAPKRFFMSGLAGFRYFRMDETLQSAVSFTNTTVGTDPTVYPGGFPTDDPRVIFDDIEVDNELIGFQLGCSLNRLIGCKWTLFCDSNFGVYNNNITKNQRVWSPGGPVRFVGGAQEDANISSEKDDIAFLGEARCGVAYQISCRARLTAAWRVVAISGVALANEQIQTDFSSIQHARYIDSNDSVVLHGLQAGVEFKY